MDALKLRMDADLDEIERGSQLTGAVGLTRCRYGTADIAELTAAKQIPFRMPRTAA